MSVVVATTSGSLRSAATDRNPFAASGPATDRTKDGATTQDERPHKGGATTKRRPAAPTRCGSTTCRRAKQGYAKYGRGSSPHTERPPHRRVAAARPAGAQTRRLRSKKEKRRTKTGPVAEGRSGPLHRTTGRTRHLKCGFLGRLFCRAEYFAYICRLITRMGERFY